MELKIEDIKSDDNIENFKSDNPSLNTYVQRDAYFEHIMKFTNTKVVRVEDEELENRYQNYKKEKGGALKMTVDQIRKLHYKQEGREEERELVEKEKKKK